MCSAFRASILEVGDVSGRVLPSEARVVVPSLAVGTSYRVYPAGRAFRGAAARVAGSDAGGGTCSGGAGHLADLVSL